MAKKKDEPERRVVAENRKARFSYAIDSTLEAGLMLMGSEVKALRSGKATIAESYAYAKDGEIFLINAYIPEYTMANRFNHEPRRPRKVLVRKTEAQQARGGHPARRHDAHSLTGLFQRARHRQDRTRHRQGQEAPRQARNRKETRLGERQGAVDARERVSSAVWEVRGYHNEGDPSGTGERRYGYLSALRQKRTSRASESATNYNSDGGTAPSAHSNAPTPGGCPAHRSHPPEPGARRQQIQERYERQSTQQTQTN